mgnify:CR=1 FL=1
MEVTMPNVIDQGIYAGVPYIVVEKDDGTVNIGLQGAGIALIAAGANKDLLQNIGDADPEEVMEKFVTSLPPTENEA